MNDQVHDLRKYDIFSKMSVLKVPLFTSLIRLSYIPKHLTEAKQTYRYIKLNANLYTPTHNRMVAFLPETFFQIIKFWRNSSNFMILHYVNKDLFRTARHRGGM